MEPPSARPWLGVGAALSALPAAGGCFCAALVLAVVADSDPGAVYEQHRWLGAIVAASAVCAFVAMMGWATLRHGGLPPPVLLMALALAAVPFLLPGGFFLPAAALAVAGSAALATHGLAHPPASPDGARFLTGFFTAAAPLLAIGQAIAVGFHDVPDRPRAKVLGSYALVAPKDPAPRLSPRAARPRGASRPLPPPMTPRRARRLRPTPPPRSQTPPPTTPRRASPPRARPLRLMARRTSRSGSRPRRMKPRRASRSRPSPPRTSPLRPGRTRPRRGASRARRRGRAGLRAGLLRRARRADVRRRVADARPRGADARSAASRAGARATRAPSRTRPATCR